MKLKLKHDFSKLVFLSGVLWLYFKLFPNSLKYRKLGFANVALVGLHNYFQFMKVMESWNFWTLAEAVLPNFSQFTKEFENWLIWVPLTFIFCQIVRTIFQAWYLCRRGTSQFMIKLPIFQKIYVHKCLCRKFVTV